MRKKRPEVYNIKQFKQGLHLKKKAKTKKIESHLIYNGHTYDSKLEVQFAKHLDLLQKVGEVTKWIPHPEHFDITVNNQHVCYYTADFEVHYTSGRIEVIDTKGFTRQKTKAGKYRTPRGYDLYQLKRKLVKALFNIDIVTVTAADLKDGKNRSHLQHPKRKTANTIQRGTRQKDKTIF